MSPTRVAFFFAALAMVVSPGVNFVLVTTTHLVEGPRRGGAMAAGMVLGGGAIAAGTIALLPLLGGDAPWVRATVSMLGGVYLGWLGVSGVAAGMGARGTLVSASAREGWAKGALLRGVVSSLTNPGLYVIYLVLLPAHVVAGAPWRREAALLAGMHIGLVVAWFALLGEVLRRARHLVSSDRAQRMVRLVGSGVLIVLGVRMVVLR